MGLKYEASELIPLTDLSNRSLKAVQLSNGNKSASVLVAHSVALGKPMEQHATSAGYSVTTTTGWSVEISRSWDFRWMRKISMLHAPVRQPGRCVGRGRPTTQIPSAHAVFLLPPLHIKLGHIKTIVKALDKGSRGLSREKTKAWMFNGPQLRGHSIWWIIEFQWTLAWLALWSIVVNFLGNHRGPARVSEDYRWAEGEFLPTRCTGASDLGSHLDYFPENCRERFPKDIRGMENCCHGRWDVNFLGDCCRC